MRRACASLGASQRAKYAAGIDPGTGELHQSGWRPAREEIDSSLGFLRYDYPEAVYSELRQLFRQALYEQQDLAAMAQKLGAQLSADRKIMLGVQLYDLISQAGFEAATSRAFYSFMSQMGMAAQAIDIVYQLNASEDSDPSIYQHGASPLESLSFGPERESGCDA